jgi:hypothetical protein
MPLHSDCGLARSDAGKRLVRFGPTRLERRVEKPRRLAQSIPARFGRVAMLAEQWRR